MWNNLKTWMSSKKAKALVLALVTLGVALASKEISPADFVKGTLLAVSVYMGAQGLADVGKAKAEIEAKK